MPSPEDPRRPPTLSVVIPVKDDAPALDRCLDMLARQTTAPLEIIVVDNGADDHTPQVATRHGVRLITEPAPGIPAAAAAGYDATRGDVVVRCDADTRPPPDWLHRIRQAFTDHPELDAITGCGDFYGVPRWRAAVQGRTYLATYYLTMHGALAHPPLWGSNMAVRRHRWQAVREAVHRTDPEVHDDVDLAFALGPHVVIRRDPTLRVGVSGRSLTGMTQWRRRLRRGVRTIRVNWRRTPVWRRWEVRLVPRSRPPSRG